MSFDPDMLYDLLPAIHRIRDSEQGEPLRALLVVGVEFVVDGSSSTEGVQCADDDVRNGARSGDYLT